MSALYTLSRLSIVYILIDASRAFGGDVIYSQPQQQHIYLSYQSEISKDCHVQPAHTWYMIHDGV